MYTSAATLGGDADLWTSVTYDLDADGHLQVGFGYDARPIEGEFERITAWRKSIEDTLT